MHLDRVSDTNPSLYSGPFLPAKRVGGTYPTFLVSKKRELTTKLVREIESWEKSPTINQSINRSTRPFAQAEHEVAETKDDLVEAPSGEISALTRTTLIQRP